MPAAGWSKPTAFRGGAWQGDRQQARLFAREAAARGLPGRRWGRFVAPSLARHPRERRLDRRPRERRRTAAISSGRVAGTSAGRMSIPGSATRRAAHSRIALALNSAVPDSGSCGVDGQGRWSPLVPEVRGEERAEGRDAGWASKVYGTRRGPPVGETASTRSRSGDGPMDGRAPSSAGEMSIASAIPCTWRQAAGGGKRLSATARVGTRVERPAARW